MRDEQNGPLDVRVLVPWNSDREAAVLRRIGRVERRRTVLRRAALAGGALSVAALVAFSRLHDGHRSDKPVARIEEVAVSTAVPALALRPPVPTAPAPPSERHLRFRDGSLATLQSPETILEIVSASEDRIVNQLVAGSVRFEITKRPRRLFRVQAGDTAVEVLGTTFQLDRDEARLRVRVTEGRVRVSWPGGRRELAAGEVGTFPPDVSGAAAARIPVRRSSPKAVPVAETMEPAPALTPSMNDAEATQKIPSEASPAAPAARVTGTTSLAGAPRHEDTLSTMLRQADDARAGGRSLDAAIALRAAAAGDRTDPRVPLAEFRLGRLLLEDLGKPREAAPAFARVRGLAPAGALASDALAREVQALAASGDLAEARGRAREYLTKYPKGSHAVWVRRWGLLD